MVKKAVLVIFLLITAMSVTFSFIIPRFQSKPASVPDLYGDGSDRTIIIRSGYTVDIRGLYENDSVSGVKTWRGENKGLNHGSGSYSPRVGACIMADTFIIEPGATLTATALNTYNTWSYNYGVIYVKCTQNFINNGSINLFARGYAGSKGVYQYGYGPGGGVYVRSTSFTRGSAGGSAYSYSLKNASESYIINQWQYLCGSGGAKGQDAYYTGGDGGAGGGSCIIFAGNVFDNSRGAINVNGQNGWGGNSTGNRDEGGSGGGGGGAGGTVYIHVENFAFLGINRITANGGAGGSRAYDCSQYPDHGGGGGGGANFTNGGTGGNGATRSSGYGGNGSIGRIHVHGNFSGSTAYPGLLELTAFE